MARLDNDGDVLVTSPAVRAVAAGSDSVVMMCGPRGEQAARLLPGVDEVLVWDAPWVSFAPPPVDAADVAAVVARLRALAVDDAVVFTSFHQSPLPLALLLRMAGVPRVSAISVDYPGSLLDVRHRVPEDIHEVERALRLAAAAGYPLPGGDDGRPRVGGFPTVAELPVDVTAGDYVVVHPGAAVPARAASPHIMARMVDALADAGPVLVTGGPAECELTATVAGARGRDLGGRTSYAELAGVLAGARAVVCGNTGPAHLASAVGTPVVSLFAPVVPAVRWAPYGVPVALLGDQDAPCRDSRARECPIPGHPCLDGIDPAAVVAAVHDIAREAVA